MGIRKILLGMVFCVGSLTLHAQTNDSSKSTREVLTAQEQNRRSFPDNKPGKTKIKNDDKSLSENNAVKSSCSPKKKKKCWFSKRSKSKETETPAAKDVLKDRNTKDPKIDKGPPKVELQK